MFIAGSMNRIDVGHHRRRDRRPQRHVEGEQLVGRDGGAQRRHDLGLLDQLVRRGSAGQAGQVEVEVVGGARPDRVRRTGGQPVAEAGELGEAVVDVAVLGVDDEGELRGVGDDERLDELVLVVVVEVEEVEEVAVGLQHAVDLVGVGDVEPAGGHRRVEHGVADALVDLAVEVVPVGRVVEDGRRRGRRIGSVSAIDVMSSTVQTRAGSASLNGRARAR